MGIENRSVVARGWDCGVGLTQKCHEGFTGVMDVCCILIVVVETQLHTFVKLINCALKRVHLIGCG